MNGEAQFVLGDILQSVQLAPPDGIADVLAQSMMGIGCDRSVIYLVDYAENMLEPLVARLHAHEPIPREFVEGSLAGRAYQLQEPVERRDARCLTLWLPLRERANRVGVLELRLKELDDAMRLWCQDLALLVAQLIRAARRYTDVYELKRRERPMELAAEMQWESLLPAMSFASDRLRLAGMLEPAYDIGGDAFEYRVNGDSFDLAIFDSMGHSLEATMVSTLALGAYRHSRRALKELTEIAHTVDQALLSHFGDECFVTGHICRIDMATGLFRWINAGHPAPLLVRGDRVVGELAAESCLPLGLGIHITEIGHAQLEAGDRLLFYSDGLVEARPQEGEEFGVDSVVEELEAGVAEGLEPAEVIRRLIKAVQEHQEGDLRDDVTLLLLEWAGSGLN